MDPGTRMMRWIAAWFSSCDATSSVRYCAGISFAGLASCHSWPSTYRTNWSGLSVGTYVATY
eukprot:5352800-Pyramimonas_sp.AAC.1